MVYFCADDYGISKESNSRIENCLRNGILNKVSVLPNGEIQGFKNHLDGSVLSLHLNLIEGKPLSSSDDVALLVNDSGYFRYSFAGLFLLSLSVKKKEFRNALYNELRSQIRFWKEQLGENAPVLIDSHQHTHMIPLIFSTLLDVIKDENLKVDYLRIPSEPVMPYIKETSLYFSYSIVGLAKQWILKILATINYRKLKKSKIKHSYFMGIMFSGRLSEEAVRKILPRYIRIAKKRGRDIEIGFHPGYVENEETLFEGYRKSFGKFYFSPWRKVEFDTLMNSKF